MRAALLATALALTLAPALPARADPPRPEIGRIAHAGYRSFSHCTAARVAPGHVLTAAHCLPQHPQDQIHLGLGYDRGAYQEIISAKASDYRVAPARDVAVLCRSQPGPVLDVAPAELAPAEVTVWGYGRPYVHILNRKTCPVLAATATTLHLGCAATPGTSGGPVTAGSPGVVVGLVSRASRTQTWVERVTPDTVSALCAAP